MRLVVLAILLGGLHMAMESPSGAGRAEPLARLHDLGLKFVAEHEQLPTDRPLTESDVRAAVEHRNQYWLNDDFDRGQALNFDLVDADLALAFLRALPEQPVDALAALKAAPLDLARPELKLRRGFGFSARAFARPWTLRHADGRWMVEVAFDPDEAARELGIAAAEEPARQQTLDAIDARLAETANPDSKLRVERQTAYRRLLAIQRARLHLSRILAASLGAAGHHEELTADGLHAEVTRLQTALKNAPAWGTRLPPPPPARKP